MSARVSMRDDWRKAHREYMRAYRASKGGLTDSDKAVKKPSNAAVKWVRTYRPDLWRQLLEDAWREVRP